MEDASVVLAKDDRDVVGTVRLDEVYVERSIEKEILAELHAGAPHGPILVAGDAGTGKTSLLWSLHGKLTVMPGYEPWLLKASFTRDLDPALLEAAVAEVRDEGLAPVLLLDTIDLLLHREADRDRLREFFEVAHESRCPLVMTCRPHEAKHVPKSFRGRQQPPLGNYDEKELGRAIDSHVMRFYARADVYTRDQHHRRLTDLMAQHRSLYDICAHPLTLRMIFVLYAPEHVPPELDTAGLYDAFWQNRVVKDRRAGMEYPVDGAPDLGPAAGWMAMGMLAQGAISIDPAAAKQLLRDGGLPVEHLDALFGRGVLRTNEDATVEFFHQTFFEHAAARGLIERLGVPGLDMLDQRARHAEHRDDLLVNAVLEQALFVSPRYGPDVRAAAGRVFHGLLRSEHVTESSAAVAVYARMEEVPPEVIREATTAMRSLVVADRFIESIASVPSRRSCEVFAHVAAIWQDSIGDASRWANCEHILDELPRLGMREDDAARTRSFLDAFRVSEVVLRLRPDSAAQRQLLFVLAALAPHDRACWRDFVMLYRGRPQDGPIGELQAAVVRVLAQQARHFGRDDVARAFEEAVGPETAPATSKEANRAWGDLWAAEWRLCLCPIAEVLEAVRNETGPPRLRYKLNGLRVFLREGTRDDGAAAWDAFIAEPDRERRAEWVRIVWQELFEAVEVAAVQAALEVPAQRIATLLAERSGDEHLHELLRKAIREAALPDPVAALLLIDPRVAEPSRWLHLDDLGTLLPFAYARGHDAATRAMETLVASAGGPSTELATAVVISMVDRLAASPCMVDPFVGLALATDQTPAIMRAIERASATLSEHFQGHAPALQAAVRRLLDAPRGVDRRHGVRLWSAMLHLRIVPPPEGPVVTEIIQRLRCERDEQARAQLANLLGMAALTEETQTEAIAVLSEIARGGGEKLRHEAFTALIRVVRAAGAAPRLALDLLDLAAQPPTDARFFREAAWLVDDLVPDALPVAKTLIERLVTSETVASFHAAGRRDLRSTLRKPMRRWMAAASDGDRQEVLELTRRVDVELACMLIDAASREVFDRAARQLKAILGAPDVDARVKRFIDMQLKLRQRAQRALIWPELTEAMRAPRSMFATDRSGAAPNRKPASEAATAAPGGSESARPGDPAGNDKGAGSSEVDLMIRNLWSRIEGIAERFGRHSVPRTVGQIDQWLRQFQSPRRIELAILLLEKVEIYTQRQMGEMIKEHLPSATDGARSPLCSPMGGLKDSGVVQVFHLSKAGVPGMAIMDLEQAAQRSDGDRADLLVLVDDIIGEGRQARHILESWLGVAKRPKSQPLSATAADLLRRTRLAFVVALGLRRGVKAVEECAAQHGLNLSVHVTRFLEPAGCFSPAVIESNTTRRDAREMAAEIGYELLADLAAASRPPDRRWSDEDRRRDALGLFGGASQLLVFDTAPPTCTLPILWKRGTYKGRPWEPLFERPET